MTHSTKLFASFSVLLGLLLSVNVFAQAGDEGSTPPDTVATYDDDEAVIDTATVIEARNVYFVNRNMQPSGGGPDSVRQATVPDTLRTRWKNDEDFWYVDYIFARKKRQAVAGNDPGRGGSSVLWRNLLWILIIGGFVTFLIIYLANMNVGLFRRKSRPVGAGDGEMEIETNNIFDINYAREIDRAVAGGNYRFAVRLLFLRLLKNMADRQLIQYKPDLTNFDYLGQLNASKHYNDFFRLARNYEYSWWGQFNIDAALFSRIRNEFDQFDNKLS